MKNSIIDSFKSKIVIKISGRNIDNFINRLIKNHINIISMDYINYKEINICLYEKDYEKVLKLKSIYDVEEIDYSGLIKIKKLINYNKILLLSIMLGIALIYTLSLFIFNIEVVHDKEEIRNIILKELKYNGVDINKLKKSDKELEKIKNNIKEKYKDKIEWIEIIVSGTKYIVKVEERKINNIENDNTPRHIISKKDAIIKKIVATSGEVVKNVDTYVKKGDIIVSGDIKLNDNTKDIIRANAKVYGEVWYKVNITMPFNYKEEVYTSNKITNYSFSFLDKNIKLKKGFKYKNEEITKIFENKYVPISLNKIIEKEIKIKEKKFNVDEAIKTSILKSRERIEEKLSKEEYIINEIQLKVNVKNSKIELEMFYTVYEDITDYLTIR